MCCDGTFFGRVRLRAKEARRAPRHTLVLLEDAESCYFDQPCAAHRGSSCAVYAERPSKCASYQCWVLGRLEDGEIGEQEARRIIAETRAEATELRHALGATEGPLLDACDALVARADSPDERRRHGELLLRVVTFIHSIRKHFGIRDAAEMK
jgi:hypothetical protein